MYGYYKDKTVVRRPFPYNGNSYILVRRHLYTEEAPWPTRTYSGHESYHAEQTISTIVQLLFCIRRRENMFPCTGHRVNSNNEWIASQVGAQFRTRASEYRRHLPPTARPWPVKNGLAPAERYHTMNTTSRRFWVGTILHWLLTPGTGLKTSFLQL